MSSIYDDSGIPYVVDAGCYAHASPSDSDALATTCGTVFSSFDIDLSEIEGGVEIRDSADKD